MELSPLSGLFAAVVVSAGLLQAPQASPATPPRDAMNLSPEEIKADITRRHPSDYYVLAGKLFAKNWKNEAAFWFYLGQLRYRFHLAANPDLPKGGEEALFASLSSMVGEPINQWAFGDIRQLLITFDKVLDWDNFRDNEFTSKTKHEAAWNDIREGLIKLREHVRANADQIRADRLKNGLQNRN
jgi:hypothetical protein